MTPSVPSTGQRCRHRGAALVDAPGGPRGSSPQRQPVSSPSSTVCTTWRKGVGGIPRLRRGGAGGNLSAKSCHAISCMPSTRPALVPSAIGRENSHTKIISVG